MKYNQDGGMKKREKHFLFPTQDMGAKNQNGGSVSVVLYFLEMGESMSLKVYQP
jgi:hypothetical protein